MTIFIKVLDKLEESFVVCNPRISIYWDKGIFCIYSGTLDAFINWNLETCIDAMELITEHQNLIFNVKKVDIVFDEDSLGYFI